MDKRKAIKLISEGDYLREQTVKMKVKDKNGRLIEEPFLIESFGVVKVSFSGTNNFWYEVWANLKNESTGKNHKMALERLIRIFPKK